MTAVIGFIFAWVLWRISYASKFLLPTWDGMVYWVNGQSYFAGRYPVYEFFRPPVLPLFLGFTQFLGMPLASSILWHPVVTGASGIILYFVLRTYVRDWLAACGSIIFLTTSVVMFWSATILTHGFSTLFLLGGVYALTKYSFRRLTLGVALLSISLFTRYPLAFVVFPIVILYLLQHRKLIAIDAILIGGLLPAIPFLLGNPFALFEVAQQIVGAEVLGQKALFVGGPLPPVSPLLYLDWLLNNLQLLTIFLVFGLIAAIKRKKGIVFAVWFLPYFVGFSFISNRQERFLFELAPAFAALIVLGAEYSLQKFNRRYIMAGLFIVLVALYAGSQIAVALPRVQAASAAGIPSVPSDALTYQIVGREINSHTRLMDIVIAENQVPWLAYYSGRYVYLGHLGGVHDSSILENYLRSFHPTPVLLVASPSLGDDLNFLDSLSYLHETERFTTPSWGWVYLYEVSLP